MQRLASALAVVLLAACGGASLSLPPPDSAPSGQLLVLETEACNWLLPPNRCDTVGLALIGLDGAPAVDLTPKTPLPMNSMALAPAGDRVAWAWNWELVAMPLDGGEPRQLNEPIMPPSMGEMIFDPAWSPDGSELLYRWFGANEPIEWHRLDVASGATERLAMPVDCWAMAWSPDGQTVACEVPEPRIYQGFETEMADIVLVDMATLEATPLTPAGDDIDDRRPAWSPSGEWLAFSRASPLGGSQPEVDGLWVVEVASGEGTRVAAGQLKLPTWSPDGGYLAFFDLDSGLTGIVARDGSGLSMLEHEPWRFSAPRWTP